MNGYKSQPWNMSIGEFFRNAVKENSTGVFIEILGEKLPIRNVLIGHCKPRLCSGPLGSLRGTE